MTVEKQKDTINGKIIYYEIIRIIAIVGVVFNHSYTLGFHLYSITDNKYMQLIYISISILCKTAVPLFLLISGALLLGKKEEISILYKKRIIRMMVALIVFSVVVYIKENNVITITGFVKGFLEGTIATPYWYMYAYICFLVSLPIIKKLVSDISIYRYIIVLCVIFEYIVPFLKYVCRINIYEYIKIPTLSMFALYPIMGYFLSKIEFAVKTKLFIVFMGMLSVVTSMFVVYDASKINRYSQVGMGDFSFFIVISIFIIIKDLGKYINEKSIVGKSIVLIGECTFGIYLFEPIIIRSVMFKIANKLIEFIPSIIAVSIGCLCAVCVGVVFVYILKKIPFVKKIV